MRTILLCLVAAALACTAVLLQPREVPAAGDPQVAAGSPSLSSKIDRWRQRTWYWQRVMGKPRHPTAYLDRRSRSLTYRQWVLELWRSRAQLAKRRALHPPHLKKWLCVFRQERHPRQGWRTQTGNGYYGGLQMDITFQRNYGGWLLKRKGRAHRWTRIEQIWVAERGRRVQGWYAWPVSARRCGLI
jgi:hypothetical protein